MVEQFSSFVQEALEFLSLLRASEKERFEAEKKFMKETTKILKELAISINKNNNLIKTTLEELKRSVNNELKKIEEKIGIETLSEAIKALETSVDLLQRGSTILDYKFTIQKTREMLDELKKTMGQVKTSPKAAESPSPTGKKPGSEPSIPKKAGPSPSPPSPSSTKTVKKTEPSPPPKPPIPTATHIHTPSPPSPQSKPSKESTDKTEEYVPSFQRYGSALDAMMGTRSTRTKEPRRVVKLKKAPRTKIVEAEGGAIEIETGSNDEE
ncbi:MAG: hypothetical protein ACTSYB_05895 [Candidatus Helarchaeota archaeon]